MVGIDDPGISMTDVYLKETERLKLLRV